MINIDITLLNNHNVSKIDINEVYTFSKNELEDTDILELKDISINGQIEKMDKDYFINVLVNGNMKLQDSITLLPLDYPFETSVEGNIDSLLEEIGESSKKTENSIDIFPIIWENILMEIPIRIVGKDSYDQKLEGEGWKFIKDDNVSSPNPELEKLKDLFK